MPPATTSPRCPRHEREGYPTLFRGGDDPPIAASEPSVISANLGPAFSPLARARAKPANPATIRNSTLLFLQYQKILPAPWSEGLPSKTLKPLENLAEIGSLSLQFLKISLQIANCREISTARPFRV
jgi:hypothetical protein